MMFGIIQWGQIKKYYNYDIYYKGEKSATFSSMDQQQCNKVCFYDRIASAR